jgi:spermidine/putrescine-binding protein
MDMQGYSIGVVVGALWLACVGLPSQAGEEVLRLLIWEGHAPSEHVASFEQRIAAAHQRTVRLQFTYVVESDDFYKAIRAKQADVVMMTHHLFNDERFNYIRKGLLLPLDLDHIPNFRQLKPALQQAEHVSTEGRVYAVPVSQGPYGLAYNGALVGEAPTSWNALWEPRFKGEYVVAENEYIYNAQITALALGYPRESINSYDALNNPRFKRKLRELALNAHSFWHGIDRPENLNGRMLATAWGDSLPPLIRQGQPWQMADPSEGTPCWIDNYAITWALADKPFLKAVAEEYINGLLSQAYQRDHIRGELGLTPVIGRADDPAAGRPALRDRNRILQQPFSTRDRNGLKLLWREAMRGLAYAKEGGAQ